MTVILPSPRQCVPETTSRRCGSISVIFPLNHLGLLTSQRSFAFLKRRAARGEVHPPRQGNKGARHGQVCVSMRPLLQARGARSGSPSRPRPSRAPVLVNDPIFVSQWTPFSLAPPVLPTRPRSRGDPGLDRPGRLSQRDQGGTEARAPQEAGACARGR